jgi:transposase
VYNWLDKARQKGSKALYSRKRGPKKRRLLKNHQAASICSTIKDRCPDQLKLFGCLWTASAVKALIKRRYGIDYSLRHTQRLLKVWGFTPQKPIRKAYEQNSELVKQWLNVEYPRIAKRAKRLKALIYWQDETGVRSDYNAGRSYSPKGQTPVIYDTGKRFGCNVISALTNKGHLLFMVIKGKFNSQVFLDFLKRLIKNKEQMIFIITDGHPAHKSKKVKDWCKANSDKIELYFLPPYSPELNPDEYLNNDLKTNGVGRHRVKDYDELIKNVSRHLRSRQKKTQNSEKVFQSRKSQICRMK